MKAPFVWLAALTAATVVPAQTFSPVALPAPTTNFGMVGLTVGQNLRVVVSNVATIPVGVTAAPTAAPLPCGVAIKILDKDGNTVGSGGQTTNLPSGQSFAAEQPGPTSGRIEYRAQVQIVQPALTGTTQGLPLYTSIVCTLVSTLQVYDTATGKTDLVLAGGPLQGFFLPLTLKSATAP